MTTEKSRLHRRRTKAFNIPAIFLLLIFSAASIQYGCGPQNDLQLDSVNPVDTSSGLSTSMTITGSGLKQGTSLLFSRNDGVPITIDIIEASEDGESARALIPAGLTAGKYDIRATQDTFSSNILSGAFTVYDGELEIIFLDVGQGDGTFIRSPRGDTLLKDAGIETVGKNTVIPFLSRRGALPPTHMIVSHRHEDHMGGITAILEGPDGIPGTSDDGIPEGELWHNEPYSQCSTILCGRYDAASRTIASVPDVGNIIDLGAGVQVAVVAVSGRLPNGIRITPEDENSASLAVVINYGEMRIFVGGDLTGGGYNTADMETTLSATIPPIHVLRVNHHGSASSTNMAFAQNLSPQAAVISAGRDNSYCHPHRSVMSRLDQVGARIFLTTPGIVHPTPDCSEPTLMPGGTVVANGHIRLNSRDGRTYTMGPVEGDAIEFRVE